MAVALRIGAQRRLLLNTADAAIALVLAVAVTVDLAATQATTDSAWPGRDATAYALGLALTLPVAVRRRYPRSVLLITLTALLFCAVIGAAEVFPGVGVCIAAYTVATRCNRRTAIAAGIAVLIVTAATKVLLRDALLSDWVVDALVLGGACTLGVAAGRQRERHTELAAHAARLELDRAEAERRAVAAERARIAREMHDVVTHSLSVIAVQSGVARHLIGDAPTPAAEALGVIEGTSRGALNDMRRMLGVLRADDNEEQPLAPTPGLADLPQLVDRSRGGDVDVRLRIEGEPRPLPPYVEFALYRVAQEGLTNTLRHAFGPATGLVTVTYDDEEVGVEIRDSGGLQERTAANGHAGGYGLAGLADRVSLAGGQFEHGPLADGGFRVCARIPLRARR